MKNINNSNLKDYNHFGDKLFHTIREKKSFLCFGLDPHLELIPKVFQTKYNINKKIYSIDNIKIVEKFSLTLIEACLDFVPVIKLQIAFFEQLGPEGLKILSRICKLIKNSSTLCIIDAKRGDIGSTNRAYANTFFDQSCPYPCDALTVNPWLGLDTIEVFLEKTNNKKGLFILVHTSNPGSHDIQEKKINNNKKVYEDLANNLKPMIERFKGKSGLSSIGIVAGATYKEQLIKLRKTLSSAPFLIPGFGAQGGTVSDAQFGLKKDKDHENFYNCGLINSSRNLCFPDRANKCKTIQDWKKVVQENLISINLKLKET